MFFQASQIKGIRLSEENCFHYDLFISFQDVSSRVLLMLLRRSCLVSLKCGHDISFLDDFLIMFIVWNLQNIKAKWQGIMRIDNLGNLPQSRNEKNKKKNLKNHQAPKIYFISNWNFQFSNFFLALCLTTASLALSVSSLQAVVGSSKIPHSFSNLKAEQMQFLQTLHECHLLQPLQLWLDSAQHVSVCLLLGRLTPDAQLRRRLTNTIKSIVFSLSPVQPNCW